MVEVQVSGARRLAYGLGAGGPDSSSRTESSQPTAATFLRSPSCERDHTPDRAERTIRHHGFACIRSTQRSRETSRAGPTETDARRKSKARRRYVQHQTRRE